MVVYVCWCYFLHLSHSLLPWLWPWVHSLCLHLHSFPAGRFINTIFLDAIYIVNILYLFFSFWRTSLCITGSRFIYLTRTDSNSLFFMAEQYSIVYMYHMFIHSSVNGQFQSVSLVAQSCPTLCDHMDCSTPGLPVHHQLPEFTQTHVHGVSDAIQPSHPLSSPSPAAFNLSQHQGLFQWVSSSH